MLALRILDSPSMVMPVPSNSPTIQSMLVGDAPRSQREREPLICARSGWLPVVRNAAQIWVSRKRTKSHYLTYSGVYRSCTRYEVGLSVIRVKAQESMTVEHDHERARAASDEHGATGSSGKRFREFIEFFGSLVGLVGFGLGILPNSTVAEKFLVVVAAIALSGVDRHRVADTLLKLIAAYIFTGLNSSGTSRPANTTHAPRMGILCATSAGITAKVTSKIFDQGAHALKRQSRSVTIAGRGRRARSA